MSGSGRTKLAIHGGAPVRTRGWPTWPVFGDAERTALNEVLDSGKWWYGERVARFERDYAAFQDARFAVTCTTGTAALEIAFEAIGIAPGDEVIIPPYTFVATASAVMRTGGVPVFADVDGSWCMDPAALEAAITPRTRAIVPVHFAGRVADMDRINAISRKRAVTVIEDACHSWGSKWKGKGTGALGLGGVFSFQYSKNITAGEGGAILSDDEAFAAACRSISNCGRVKGSPWYHHALVGTNARLTEFAGALLSAQLTRLEAQTALREKNAAILDAGLAGIEGITPQPGDPRITRRAYHLYCVRIDAERFGCSRESFVKAAEAEGLPIGAGYVIPLYQQPALAGSTGVSPSLARPCMCPVTEDLCARSGMWFHHALLLGTEDDMRDIIGVFKKIQEHVGELRD